MKKPPQARKRKAREWWAWACVHSWAGISTKRHKTEATARKHMVESGWDKRAFVIHVREVINRKRKARKV